MDFSPGYLLASFAVSTVGFSLMIYGKKQLRMPQLGAGLALMIYPYFVTSPIWIYAVAGVLLSGLWVAIRWGL